MSINPDTIRAAERDGIPNEGEAIGSVEDAICLSNRVEIGTHRSPTYGRDVLDAAPALLGTLDVFGDESSTIFLTAKGMRRLSALALIAADILDPTPVAKGLLEAAVTVEWAAEDTP